MILNYTLMIMITLVIQARKQPKRYAEIIMNIKIYIKYIRYIYMLIVVLLTHGTLIC